jgi:uncharacterized protein
VTPGSRTALDPSRAYKPLDVGEAGVAASVDPAGRLLAVSQGHPEHGVVVLEACPPLPEHARRDAVAVRNYRSALAARDAPAFGPRAAGPGRPETNGHGWPAAARPRAWLLEHAIPATGLPGVRGPALATVVPADGDNPARGLVQVVLPGVEAPPLRWDGTVRMGRAAYSELTERAPLPQPATRPAAELVAGHPVLHDRALRWAVALAGDLAPGARVGLQDGWLRVDAKVRPGGRLVALGLGPDPEEAVAAARELAAAGPDATLRSALDRWRSRWAGWPLAKGPLEPLARHGLAYLLGCCAVPVRDTTCLVTDHRILPLAWTRDAYFMAGALLAWARAGGPAEALHTVRRHLDWLFGVAERPEGWWARSHLVGGQPKDVVFQLDQQLYPLLELADYVEASGDRSVLERHAPAAVRVLEVLERRRSSEGAALYSSDENPADDPLELPYQTSGQILAWHTFMRLDRLGLRGARGLARRADTLARAVARHQVVRSGDGEGAYAYANDLAGHSQQQHDANDLPLALAPAWGFCEPDDPLWSATMRLALSGANPGYYPGRHGGLGSPHTPGPWPLGHAQEVLAARWAGDRLGAEAAELALADAALWDGSLPEASDPASGLPRSRPWFAWPGALAATLALDREHKAASWHPAVSGAAG